MSNLAVESSPDYSWAEYLHCMEGGSDVLSLPQSKPSKAAVAARKEHPVLGLSVAVGLTVAAVYLSEVNIWPFTIWTKVGTQTVARHPVEPVMLAIILGIILSNVISLPKSFGTGIKYSVKKLLPLGIIFLGARLNFLAVMKVGASAVLLSVLETVIALSFLIYLAKRFNLPRKLGLLLGVGTAICGGTAIVATAPVLEAEEKDVVFSVATVTLLGLIAMFLLPVLGNVMHMTEHAFGVWAGLAIHQTPQVVAAGFAYGNEAGETATIVKLARVCLLAPVVFIVGWLQARSDSATDGAGKKRIDYWHLFPMFVFGFLAMALLRTTNLLPDVTLHLQNAAWFGTGNFDLTLPKAFEELSKYCIIISMAGVGLETKFAAMRQTGSKPFLASLLAAILIAGLTLAAIKVCGI